MSTEWGYLQLGLLLLLETLATVTSKCTPIPFHNCQALCEWTDGTNITLDLSNIGVTFP